MKKILGLQAPMELASQGLLEEGERARESLWWKDLKKVCGGRSSDRWFHKGVEWKVRKRDKIRFWLDDWVSGRSLAILFPRLYLISEQKLHTLGRMGEWRDGVWFWELKWRRNTFE